MLLRLRAAVIRRHSAHAEDGMALVTAIGVIVVVTLIAMLLAGSAVSAAAFSSTVRAQVQARAAADAGLDLVWASMQGGSFPCSITASGTVNYATTVSYRDKNGVALNCAGSFVSGVPAKATVSSTGDAVNDGVNGISSGDSRTIIGLFDIVVNPGTVNLDKAVFSEGGYTITNNTQIVDSNGLGQANLYSNSSVECRTSVGVQGWVLVQGDFSVGQTCYIQGTVWAGGGVSANSQVKVTGDILSRGGPGPSYATVDLKNAWVGGSVVANGSVLIDTASNSNYCPVHGYDGKVCGSVVSLYGTITTSNAARIGGNAYANGTVDIGTTNNNLIVGGNVVSKTGGLNGSNFGSSGYRVGGYVATKGTSVLPKARVGNAASSCAGSSTANGYVACVPASPSFSLAGLPAALNFPTNSDVVAPPRESLPRITSDATGLAKWIAAGWTVQTVPCASAKSTIAAGWTGKLLLKVTGCTDQLEWSNQTITLPGDLVVLNPAGFNMDNPVVVKSNNSTKRTIQWIVPSDGKRPDGTTNLVSWTTPVATDPDYTKGTCWTPNPDKHYGDITSKTKTTYSNVETFMYTPCDIIINNSLDGFVGQAYGGYTELPGNSVVTFKKQDVPGATTTTSVAPFVSATETARFDARDAG